MGGCIGSCLATCGCACLDKACGGCRSKSGSLIPYMILFILSTVVALILRYWGQPMLVDLYVYHLDVCTTDKCLGIGGVNRISFALFVFFFFHAIPIRFITSCSRLDSQTWWFKLLFFIVLLVCAWLIPDDFYGVYMQIARVVSAFFLVLQLIILIDFGYSWSESWTSEDKPWGPKAVLGVSALMYIASLTFFILDIVYFGGGGCNVQKFLIAFTFILTFLTTGLSISPWIEDGGGILPAGVVTLYSYWLLFSALTSDPSDCNTVSSRSKDMAPMIIGLTLSACSVTYASWSVATNTALFNGSSKPASEKENLNSAAASGDSGSKDIEIGSKSEASSSSSAADDDDDEVEEPADSVASLEKARLSARFHFLMACASMYICMVLSGWGDQSSAESGDSSTDLDTANMWIKIVTQWVCLALYVWTLVARKCCPNRDFD